MQDLLEKRLNLAREMLQNIEEAKQYFKDGNWEIGLEKLKLSISIVEDIILTGKNSIWKDIYKDSKVPPYGGVNHVKLRGE
jgi:hypothetical protein